MNILYLAWHDSISHRWFPIGRLRHLPEQPLYTYEFLYLQGFQKAQEQSGLCPLPSFPQINETYVSDELFPFFANRVMRRTRPDFKEHLGWLNIDESRADPLPLLARTGGGKESDLMEMFAPPEQDADGLYRFRFFSHKTRLLPVSDRERLLNLSPGERLRIQQDMQTLDIPGSLLLQTEHESKGQWHTTGYCPRFLTEEIMLVLLDKRGDVSVEAVEVRVERINPPPAPMQFRMLCSLTVQPPLRQRPFQGEEYNLLGKEVEEEQLQTIQ